MKSISFISGSAFDTSSGMDIIVDRSAIPTQMRLGMWLDDDGKAFPTLPRARPAGGAGGEGEIVFIDATKLKMKIGGVEGIVSVAAGTRVDLTSKSTLGDVKVTGATVAYRGARRFAQITAPKAEFTIDKAPNAQHVLTLEAEKPSGARPGDQFRVDVAQRNASGVVVGGITVLFTFDT